MAATMRRPFSQDQPEPEQQGQVQEQSNGNGDEKPPEPSYMTDNPAFYGGSEPEPVEDKD